MRVRPFHYRRRCIARPTRPPAGSILLRRGGLAPAGLPLTSEQVEAIAAVMRLFIEDDLANGVSPSFTMRCAACARVLPVPGFVRYGPMDVCNRCATDYETRRAGGVVQTITEYLTERDTRRSA